MATYTLSNKECRSQAYMLLCDDTVRDYGNVEVAASFQKKGEQRGFYAVSMKEDFKMIYKEGARQLA